MKKMERHAPLTYVDRFLLPAVVDNIDHDPSSTTATGSFHGTSISLIQHTTEEGYDMGQIAGVVA